MLGNLDILRIEGRSVGRENNLVRAYSTSLDSLGCHKKAKT